MAVTADLAIALLLVAAAGLLVRGRISYCCWFFVYLVAAATFQFLAMCCPGKFFNFSFYAAKETALVVLKMLVAIEICC